jgi:threonine dehydratase
MQIIFVESENFNIMCQSLVHNKRIIVNVSRYCDDSSVKQISEILSEICKNVDDLLATVASCKISVHHRLCTLSSISEPVGVLDVIILGQFR